MVRRLIRTKDSDFTTKDLVTEAGVVLRTFYRYFASKDDLLPLLTQPDVVESVECPGANHSLIPTAWRS